MRILFSHHISFKIFSFLLNIVSFITVSIDLCANVIVVVQFQWLKQRNTIYVYSTVLPKFNIFAWTKWDGTKYFTLLQCRLAIFRNCALSSRHILAASTLAGLKIQVKIFIDDLHRATKFKKNDEDCLTSWVLTCWY